MIRLCSTSGSGKCFKNFDRVVSPLCPDPRIPISMRFDVELSVSNRSISCCSFCGASGFDKSSNATIIVLGKTTGSNDTVRVACVVCLSACIGAPRYRPSLSHSLRDSSQNLWWSQYMCCRLTDKSVLLPR